MQAAVIHDRTAPISVDTVPIPDPLPGTAVVRVLAGQIGPTWGAILSGKLPMPVPEPPFSFSGPTIGRIHAPGPDTTSLKQGQLVYVGPWIRARDDPDLSILFGALFAPSPEGQILSAAWKEKGTIADYARCPLEVIFPLNESLLVGELGYTFAELTLLGAALVVSGGLFGPLEAKPGDTVIIAPATGKFGSTAVRVALAMGCRVVAAGRNEETLASFSASMSRSGSTGRLITVRLTGDVPTDTAALKKAAGGAGADAYFDWSPPASMGSTHITACIGALRPNGRCALMGYLPGNIQISYADVMMKNIRIEGRFMYERENAVQIIKMVEAGTLELPSKAPEFIVHGGFKIADVNKAFEEAAVRTGWAHHVVIEP